MAALPAEGPARPRQWDCGFPGTARALLPASPDLLLLAVRAAVHAPRRSSLSTLRGRERGAGAGLGPRWLGSCSRSLSTCPRARSAFGLRLAEVAKSGALGRRSAG